MSMTDQIYQFSFFRKPVMNVEPYCAVDIVDVFRYVAGYYAQQRTATLRSIPDAKGRATYKANNFDFCCFSGLFRKRNERELVMHSGLMCIDFDHVADIPRLKDQLLNHPYFDTELMFTSPSGDGVKWIIPVELQGLEHKKFFGAVVNCLRATGLPEVDTSGKDVARACFLPHDPEAFINPKYQEYVENPFRPTELVECPF